MRTIPPSLQSKLDSGVTKLCWCWTITRTDQSRFRFTDHDRRLTFQGENFEPHQSLHTSQLEQQVGTAPDNAQIQGILDHELLTDSDLTSGRFDDAKVDIFRVDWEEPDLFVAIWTGYFGQVQRSEHGFKVDLLGPSTKLDRVIGNVYTRQCTAELGDSRCQFNLNQSGYAVTSSVDSQNERVITISGLESYENHYFSDGILKWDSGTNSGLQERILVHRAPNIIELLRPPDFDVSTNDSVTLIAGCDKNWTTCKQKFSNLINFRGFPDLLGIDAVVQPPAQNIVHDGGSRRS